MEDYNEALADNAPAGWKRKAALFLSSQALSLAGSIRTVRDHLAHHAHHRFGAV